MAGEMIEAMAEAIENSKAMIVCMSEKYKLSPNCQSGKLSVNNNRSKNIQ